MKNMTLSLMAEAVGGELYINGKKSENVRTEEECTSVVIDSRKAEQGSLFVATVGERVDGHSYIAQVLEKGALGVICEKKPEDWGCGPVEKASYILVENSFTALKKLAKYYREQMKDVICVGIVGSVGKTSTKELVAAVLSQSFNTHKTQGNLNNEVGVPLTVLGIRDEHDAAVIEMGISDFNEMDRLGCIVKPDGVVMTNIGPCHLEKLGDLDGVLRAKSECIKHIKENGFLAVNGDDAKLATVTDIGARKLIRFGKNGSIFAENTVSRGLEGSDFTLCLSDTENGTVKRECTIPLPGMHMVQNALAAAAVGRELGMSADAIVKGAASVKPVSGRSNLIRTDRYLLVDDCYNANPKSMMAAIDLLKESAGRHCAILGDMFELGENEKKLHAEVGAYAASQGTDILVCIGALSKNMFEAADIESKFYFENVEEFNERINEIPFQTGDTILVKASHGMHLERIIEKFTEK